MADRSAARRVTRRLPVIREEVDARYNRQLVEEQLGTTVACQKGCAHCCHQLVSVSMMEAVDIHLHVQKHPLLAYRVRQWVSAQVPLLMKGMTAPQWFALQKRCVFLDGNNACSIYERRPFPCRWLMALGTADNCRLGAEDAMVKRPDHRPALEYTYVNTSVEAERADLPVGAIPLPLGLQWADILWNQGKDALRRHIKSTGIPAYSHVEHLLYWAQRLQPDEVGLDELLQAT